MTLPDWLISTFTHPVTLLTLGGGAGTNARFWLGRLIARIQGPVEFPWATLTINITGSIALGMAVVNFLAHPDPNRRAMYLLLGTGFCGGYTTFSTFSFEAIKLLQDGKHAVAGAYVFASVVGGLVGMWAGLYVASRI